MLEANRAVDAAVGGAAISHTEQPAIIETRRDTSSLRDRKIEIHWRVLEVVRGVMRNLHVNGEAVASLDPLLYSRILGKRRQRSEALCRRRGALSPIDRIERSIEAIADSHLERHT